MDHSPNDITTILDMWTCNATPPLSKTSDLADRIICLLLCAQLRAFGCWCRSIMPGRGGGQENRRYGRGEGCMLRDRCEVNSFTSPHLLKLPQHHTLASVVSLGVQCPTGRIPRPPSLPPSMVRILPTHLRAVTSTKGAEIATHHRAPFSVLHPSNPPHLWGVCRPGAAATTAP